MLSPPLTRVRKKRGAQTCQVGRLGAALGIKDEPLFRVIPLIPSERYFLFLEWSFAVMVPRRLNLYF